MQDSASDCEFGPCRPRCAESHRKKSWFPVRHTVPSREHPVGRNETAGAADATAVIDDFRHKGELATGNALSADNVRGPARVDWVLLCSKTGGNQSAQYDVFHKHFHAAHDTNLSRSKESSKRRPEWRLRQCPKSLGAVLNPQRNVAKSLPSFRASVSACSKGQRSFWSPSRSCF